VGRPNAGQRLEVRCGKGRLRLCWRTVFFQKTPICESRDSGQEEQHHFRVIHFEDLHERSQVQVIAITFGSAYKLGVSGPGIPEVGIPDLCASFRKWERLGKPPFTGGSQPLGRSRFTWRTHLGLYPREVYKLAAILFRAR